MLTFSAHVANRAPIISTQHRQKAAARIVNVRCASRSTSSTSGSRDCSTDRCAFWNPFGRNGSHIEGNDGYQFLYPFGWQEISVQGQDIVFKDVVEPLESVSVSFIPTDAANIQEYGPAETVAETLARQVLTAPTQTVELLKAELRDTNGTKYLEFEFTVDAKRYKRHSIAVVTVVGGKFYTLTTGANERRWGKVQDKLRTMVRSFQMIDYSLS